MNKSNKTNAETIARTLTILRALANKPLSSTDLLKIIEKETGKVYRLEVIHKYINTLKIVGFQIEKKHNLFYLLNNTSKIDLNEKELLIMNFIESYTPSLENPVLTEQITKALQIIEKSFSEETQKRAANITKPQPIHKLKNNCTKIKKIYDYCAENLRLKIKYKSEISNKTEDFKIFPKKIIHKNNHPFVYAINYETNEYQMFLIQNIKEITQLPQKNSFNTSTTVIFKLKDRLKNAYKLKEGETIIEENDNYIVVSNKLEDRALLLRRLLRYFDNCEILQPKSLREDMKKLITDMESIYEQ